MYINNHQVSSKNPIDLEECRSKVKVTGVKTLYFLAHSRLVRTKSQNRTAANGIKVPIKQQGSKYSHFLADFRLIWYKSQFLLHESIAMSI